MAEAPPTTEDGVTVRLAKPLGRIARFAVSVVPPDLPVIVALVEYDTLEVPTAKETDVAPNGTMTKAGRTAEVELQLSKTTSPPAGAAEESVTVPVDVAPPITDVGLTVNPFNVKVFTSVPIA